MKKNTKKYEITIEVFDRYTGTSYETEIVEVQNKREANKKAKEKVSYLYSISAGDRIDVYSVEEAI